MFNSTVLEVAIGMVFCYASVTLIVSSVNEGIASALKLRANSLLAGIKSLLNDQGFQGLARDIYNHALVNPLDGGEAKTENELNNKPSYIDPKQFAQALIDVIQRGSGDFAQLGSAIDKVPNAQLRQMLNGMYTRANGKVEDFRDAVATWFDASMDRVSGTYKRRSQLICFLLALLIAGLFNIDSLHLFQSLWQHPAFAEAIRSTWAETDAGQILDGLKALPIGWQKFPPAMDAGLLLVLAGWLVTASSALFGAPFWFDLLQRLVQLRGTGAKPGADKKE